MKNILLISLLILSACSRKKSTWRPLEKKDSTANMVIPPVTTAMPIEPLRDLPPGFRLDSSVQENKETNHTESLYFPVSEKHEMLNYLIRNIIDDEAQRSAPSVRDRSGESSYFALWLSEFHVTKEVISICFTSESYYPGAAHTTHSYTAFAYDIPMQQRMLFTSFFKFDNDQAKQAFCDAINDCCKTGSAPMEPIGITTMTNFVYAHDTVSLFFSDYEKEPSMSRLDIPVSKVKKFLDPSWAKDAGIRF